ncbi:MAG: cob(I)yrinic acid a,c-diamide adenosyltransferase [Planctomycetota bacterium]|nr:cob(I)yrinic acid a,c-diamide adenosyltransferase [Planctomycetota bacterium]
MVKLNRIYTKTGDDGTTGLATGARVRKDDLAVEAYGTVDEANSALGLCVIEAANSPIATLLASIQHDLFDLGADLATPLAAQEAPGTALRIIAAQTERLERAIDQYNEPIPALTSFVLPGGTRLAAYLHLARTIVRRAERISVALRLERPEQVSQEAIKYLNRLSDLLFVLSRTANGNGAGDVLWVPGVNRRG